jgi:hypothetical protein
MEIRSEENRLVISDDFGVLDASQAVAFLSDLASKCNNAIPLFLAAIGESIKLDPNKGIMIMYVENRHGTGLLVGSRADMAYGLLGLCDRDPMFRAELAKIVFAKAMERTIPSDN